MAKNKIKERKKINNIEEIWDGEKLIIKDFSNLDLEGLDLSVIPSRVWWDCNICNTSFKNTGVNLTFVNIRNSPVKDCDFSYNTSFNVVGIEIQLFENCDFRETNITADIYGKNNYLDKNFKNWSRLVGYQAPLGYKAPPIDIETLEKNPQLELSSVDLFYIIFSNFNFTRTKSTISLIEEFLKYDKQGDLKKLYNILKNELMDYEMINLFSDLRILNVVFKDINFEDINYNLLGAISFNNCEFENLTLEHNLKDLLYIPNNSLNGSNKFGNINTPNIYYNSWQEDRPWNTRVSQTPVTFRTNLYLELGRLCNCECDFCRNSYYCDNTYDFKKIEKTLKKTFHKLDSVVIGGGEPTLRLDDLKKISDYIKKTPKRPNFDLYLFTNGSCKYIDSELNAKFNISRHAIDDYENARIFGIDKSKIMSTLELERFINRNRNTTLAATCFKGGLDTKEKLIDYIEYATWIGCKNILFSDLIVMEEELLQTKDNYTFNIDKDLFNDVIKELKKHRFEKNIPIYGTGGYELIILKKGDVTISFKHYISKKELEEKWPKAIKRTFDLSIDPKGNLFENWHQTSEPVSTKKLKLK